MVTIPNVGAHGRSEMVNLKGVHHKYQSRLKRSGKIVNFCPFSEQRFSMIPADSQAPLRVCYSHDMSRHPIERIEASSGQFLRNWAFCDPYFAVFYYRKSPFCPTLEQYFPMCPSDCQAPLRVCYSHDMSPQPIERMEASSGQSLRNWAFCDSIFTTSATTCCCRCRYALETMSIARIMLWVTKQNISAHHLE